MDQIPVKSETTGESANLEARTANCFLQDKNSAFTFELSACAMDPQSYGGLNKLILQLEKSNSAESSIPNLVVADNPDKAAQAQSAESINQTNADDLANLPAFKPLIDPEKVTWQSMKDWTMEKSQLLTPNNVIPFAFMARLKSYTWESEAASVLAKTRPVANFAGLVGAWALYEDGKNLLNSKTGSDMAYYGAASLGDISIVAGAVLNNVPSLRKYGAAALGLGMLYRIALPAVTGLFQMAGETWSSITSNR